MALYTRAIKSKIRSVGNIKKITRAMQMVAASKLRRATAAAFATREYAALALDLLVEISKEREMKHPFLTEGTGDGTLYIVIGANRGLCGGFNVSLARSVGRFISAARARGEGDISFITVGRRAERLAKNLGGNLRASFINFPDNLSADDIGGLTRLVFDEYRTGAYRRVVVCFNKYISAISYMSVARSVLPVRKDLLQNILANLEAHEEIRIPEDKKKDYQDREEGRSLYKFEPDKAAVLAEILPGLVSVQILQALLESKAAEESARMLAMKNATDNAQKFVENLTLSYNHARQDAITQEIAEISGGAAALHG